ncbi:MAG: GNAT family N-acetyltransferase [Myxococcales bacterium]|nr:GNAT family N-acetyltransferase [Myxococcales bacterium]
MRKAEELAPSPLSLAGEGQGEGGREGRLRLVSVRDGLSFARLRPEWDALLERSGAGVFNSWEWLYPWYHRIGPDRELMILLARDEAGELVGLLPLCLSWTWAAGRRLRRLSFLGESRVGSDYLDVVARAGMEPLVAASFARAVRDARAGWDVLELSDVDQDSWALRAFREAFVSPAWQVEVSDRFTCPFETFASGTRFEDFLRKTGRRDNFLRRRKWLSSQEGFRIERTVAPSEVSRPLAELLRLHAQRWARDGGSQGINGPSVEAFHRDAAEYLAERGWLRLFTLLVGKQVVASVYGIAHRSKFIYYQSGFDPTWASRSVGLVLTGETFRDAIESGLSEYDFLRGTEAYKADWTTQERRTVAVRVWEKGGRGRWLSRGESAERLLRGVAKRVLPRAAVESIRRYRRRRASLY